MNALELSVYLTPIIAACPLWKNRNLHAVIIANPSAGGFSRRKYADEHETILVDFCAAAQQQKQQCKNLTTDIYQTETVEKTAIFVQNLVKEASMSENYGRHYLLITAGGDGTSQEVQTALAKIVFDLGAEYATVISGRITILRLPFGTGNDGSDGRTLEETLQLLTQPAHFALQRAVKVSFKTQNKTEPAGVNNKTVYDTSSANPPWYAFNIASIGIDAYITHMTNKTKNILPGNFYKLWIDLACLFYNFTFKAGSAEIKFFGRYGLHLQTIQTWIEFCLFGVSGHRTYGSNQKILPDDRNICICKKMNLFSKLLLKEKFKKGTHTQCSKALFFSAEKISIDYDNPILLQLDGEVHYVKKENFPLIMERTMPAIRIIELDDQPFNKGADKI